tara:strand:+ start:2737 stop:3072 length:336 start_codon:yes stop_codon:yes gene_type:complete
MASGSKASQLTEQLQIQELMKLNPVIDYLLAECVIRMSEEERQEMIAKDKAGTLVDPYPNQKVECYTIKSGEVLSVEECDKINAEHQYKLETGGYGNPNNDKIEEIEPIEE